ncbi:MAG: hypothetical protein KC457_01295 [Myxococcales bacterium]|nr:hypothetical protein [Myxococcales bacterium]
MTIDPATGARVIDADFLQSLEDNPNQLLADETSLRQAGSGHYEVAVQGELAAALGWKQGDLLVAVEGLEIKGVGGYVEAYTLFGQRTAIELTVLRGGVEVILEYRVE